MRSIFRRLRRSATVFGLGAATAYFLDPDEGATRRQRVVTNLRGAVAGNAVGGSADELAPSPLSSVPSADVGAPSATGAHADPTGGAAPVQA